MTQYKSLFKVYMVSFWTEPSLIFWIFIKNPCKKKKGCINYFDEQKNPEYIWKYSRKKPKNFKAIGAVLGYSKPRIFFFGQPWWPTFFSRPWPPNPFTAATALQKPTQKRCLQTCKNPRPWNMEKLIMLLSKLIKKNLLLFTDDAYKLKESTITDETEIEIEIEVLNPLIPLKFQPFLILKLWWRRNY